MRLEVEAVTTQRFSDGEELHPAPCSWVIPANIGPRLLGFFPSSLWDLSFQVSSFPPSALLKVFVP